jgi:hypothetical protein
MVPTGALVALRVFGGVIRPQPEQAICKLKVSRDFRDKSDGRVVISRPAVAMPFN